MDSGTPSVLEVLLLTYGSHDSVAACLLAVQLHEHILSGSSFAVCLIHVL